MSKILTLEEVQTWLAAVQLAVRNVQDELLLIQQEEARKHKHFHKDNLQTTLSKIPESMKNSLIARVHEVADARNITLLPGDCSSKKFVEIFMSLVEEAMKEVKVKYGHVIPEELMFDDTGRCGHDAECDKRIQNSLEYITTIIQNHERGNRNTSGKNHA